jgi:DNA-directed RNA polymerase subunit RPC12/RpoP
MITTKAPNPQFQLYDVACSDKDCGAEFRARKDQLTLESNKWVLVCPYCATRTTIKDLPSCGVKKP